MKKYLVLTLLMILLFILFAACGSSNQASSDNSANSVTTEETQVEKVWKISDFISESEVKSIIGKEVSYSDSATSKTDIKNYAGKFAIEGDVFKNVFITVTMQDAGTWYLYNTKLGRKNTDVSGVGEKAYYTYTETPDGLDYVTIDVLKSDIAYSISLHTELLPDKDYDQLLIQIANVLITNVENQVK